VSYYEKSLNVSSIFILYKEHVTAVIFVFVSSNQNEQNELFLAFSA